MPNNSEESDLNIFFEMIDSIEEDISEILEDESNQIGGYGCLVICFNYLRLYCGQIGIKFSQIEDHYSAFKESKTGDTFLNSDIDPNPAKGDKVKDFSKVLEEIESCLATFEQRCKKTGESFDEWNCVFVLYSCLRKYCGEIKANYAELMSDISRIQSDFKKSGDTKPEDVSPLN